MNYAIAISASFSAMAGVLNWHHGHPGLASINAFSCVLCLAYLIARRP